MKIEKNTVVTLKYRLTENDKAGSLIEEVTEQDPFIFLFGQGQLLPKFEENLKGLEIGHTFSFTLTPEEAYGEYLEENIVDIPIQIFMKNGKIDKDILFEGNVVPLQDQQGNVFEGVILDIGLENVRMDFNHPLAGKSLHFEGEILGIREATAEEIAHGHAHTPGGRHA
ncbi:MAG: peptidylprolyl isomerase [Bacteroidales bacterium]|nr:peptidylprolyl isomerase [Bacteroidales bacterium]